MSIAEARDGSYSVECTLTKPFLRKGLTDIAGKSGLYLGSDGGYDFMSRLTEKVYKRVTIQEGSQVIEQLFLESYIRPGISTKELARRTLLPIPVATAIKKELMKVGMLHQDRGVRCTDEGLRWIEQECGFDGLDKQLYEKLMEGDAEDLSELNEILSELRAIMSMRPQVNVQIDQSKCTPETSLRRAILCLKHYALIGKRVLCVGDDDLVSVSLALLVKRLFPQDTGTKARIDVIDVDERFVAYIRELAERYSLPITCILHDLRQPLPDEMVRKYDCFFTDPPYTLQGMTLFVSRGMSALKSVKGLPIFLSFAHKSPDVTVAMQREFVRMGLVVNAMLPRFNQYEGAEMIANHSQMIVLKTTEFAAPEHTGFFVDAMYTGEIKRTVRTYRCLDCEQAVLVGLQGAIATIEQLKNEGCPGCGNDTFRLVERRDVQQG